MDAFQYLPYTINVLNRIWKRINLKKALATKGQPFFDDLDSAILTFFRDYFNAIGDYVLYSYILEPEDPKREAEMIVYKLREDYENLINATKNLILFFVAHKEELKGLLKPKDWLLLEEIMVAFEGDKPNWDFLYQVAKSVEVTQNEKQIEFEITLNRLLEEFNRETGADRLMKRIMKDTKKKRSERD
ncbi:hypothetical protein JCM16138_24280 [Thermococcus atlanticus]